MYVEHALFSMHLKKDLEKDIDKAVRSSCAFFAATRYQSIEGAAAAIL